MLAPCWRRSGVLRGPWAFLGRSEGRLELTFDQHGKEDEKERLDFRKILQNTVFSIVFEGPEDWFWMALGCFWGPSGVFGRSWGPLGRLVAVLEASWECLGVFGNAEERLTMFACV